MLDLLPDEPREKTLTQKQMEQYSEQGGHEQKDTKGEESIWDLDSCASLRSATQDMDGGKVVDEQYSEMSGPEQRDFKGEESILDSCASLGSATQDRNRVGTDYEHKGTNFASFLDTLPKMEQIRTEMQAWTSSFEKNSEDADLLDTLEKMEQIRQEMLEEETDESWEETDESCDEDEEEELSEYEIVFDFACLDIPRLAVDTAYEIARDIYLETFGKLQKPSTLQRNLVLTVLKTWAEEPKFVEMIRYRYDLVKQRMVADARALQEKLDQQMTANEQ